VKSHAIVQGECVRADMYRTLVDDSCMSSPGSCGGEASHVARHGPHEITKGSWWE
jgi:hypothetical protein